MGRKVDDIGEDFGPDTLISALAGRQRGRVAWWQLKELGVARHYVNTRIDRGSLIREHHGVFLVGHPDESWDGRAQAALLAAGPNSALSHRAAAAKWGIAEGSVPIEVSAPRSRGGLTGVIVHRPRSLTGDVVELDALRVTTVARTLVDLCSSLSANHVARLYREAQFRGLVSREELADVLARSYGRRGINKLKRLARDEVPLTKTELERRFVKLVADAGLPTPRTNERLRIGGRTWEVDAHWPTIKLAVELDGRQSHQIDDQFEIDRERDIQFTLEGWRVARFTWVRLRDDPAGTIRDLNRLLSGAG